MIFKVTTQDPLQMKQKYANVRNILHFLNNFILFVESFYLLNVEYKSLKALVFIYLFIYI